MAISKETVEYVAHLARIELEPHELDRLSSQLKDILDFINTLATVDVKDINPTSHILPIHNILRGDEPKNSLPSEKALENAPDKHNNFFGVPKIIE